MQDSLAQLSCLKEACKRLGLSFTEHDTYGNLISVEAPSGPLYFANFATPFNSGAVEQICRDKEFTQFLLHKHIFMPRVQGYFDPEFREGYERFKKFTNIKSIISDFESKFSYPLVIKKNSGTRGINVFLCQNAEAAEVALETIFRKDSPDYDYIALVQEYIKPSVEYRAVMFHGRTVLLYRTKGPWSSDSKTKGKNELPAEKTIEDFLSPVQNVFPAVFFGADIIEDTNGKLWLLEVNSRPGFARFISDFGEEAVISMYEKMLKARA